MPSCKKLFFCKFQLYFEDITEQLKSYDRKIYPNCKILIPLPKEIATYYPKFYEIYSQSAKAENYNLNEITGMAYRKALENLVKTYLAEMYPDEISDILNEPLGKSISRISYPKIQSLARAISWIGNDQTHMIQKNLNYNINDMKAFILALCHLILAEKEADKALSETSSP